MLRDTRRLREACTPRKNGQNESVKKKYGKNNLRPVRLPVIALADPVE